jgi:4-diphosphocytidyl-2-C-methyl-D-erythritol kinase
VIAIPSFAKINLSLETLRERPDGYVELRTIFQSIDLRDDLRIAEAPRGEILVRCSDPALPQGEENLAGRAARLFLERTGIDRGVRIDIVKRVPAGAGLGGGSANAASALAGLDRLFGTRLGPEQLHPIAARLGSDVPFFLYGGTALGLGRGDEVYPLPDFPAAEVLIALPPFRIATPDVYARVKRVLTPREAGHTIWRFAPWMTADVPGYSFMINELEPAAAAGQESLPALRGRLVELGADEALLCGSGSAVFGLFADLQQDENGGGRRQAAERVSGLLSWEFPGTTFFRCRTLTGVDYREAIHGARGGKNVT